MTPIKYGQKIDTGDIPEKKLEWLWCFPEEVIRRGQVSKKRPSTNLLEHTPEGGLLSKVK